MISAIGISVTCSPLHSPRDLLRSGRLRPLGLIRRRHLCLGDYTRDAQRHFGTSKTRIHAAVRSPTHLNYAQQSFPGSQIWYSPLSLACETNLQHKNPPGGTARRIDPLPKSLSCYIETHRD